MLTPIREDLNLYLSDRTSSGSPNWTIHDPVRNKFFQIEWRVYEVLCHWTKGTAELISQAVNKETTLEIDENFVKEVEKFCRANQLCQATKITSVENLINCKISRRNSWLRWLLHHYLFFRIPLFRCDNILTKTYPYIKFMFSKWFLILNIISLFLGLFLITHQWDIFNSQITELLSFKGMILFVITLVFVKISHELGHAYTAKRYGCNIPVMGVAFLVLWPMFYTDTNESWKLRYRSQRLKIAGAGVLVELMLAGFATLAWCFLPSGILRDVAFIMATTTWISSLVINASPFMKFDGYYLLSDFLNIPNLHERSGNIARWWLREKLFNLNEEKPEIFPQKIEVLLIIFAFSVWVYRLILFIGIALLVYSFFTKVLGVFLFLIEIGWFILRPIWFEFRQWGFRKKHIFSKTRVWFLLAFSLLLIFSLFIPWRGSIVLNSTIQAKPYKVIYVTTNGRLEDFISTEGVAIRKGDLIVKFVNPSLNLMLKNLTNKIELKKEILKLAAFDDVSWKNNAVIASELANLETQRRALREKIGNLNIYAPIDGISTDISRDLLIGQWLNNGQRLFAIRGVSGFKVIAYINEEDVSRVELRGSCNFTLVQHELKKYPCKLVEIGSSSVDRIDEKTLATVYGGSVSASYEKEVLIPDQAVYKLVANIENTTLKLNHKTKGMIEIEAVRRNLINRFWYWFVAVIIREGGM